LCAGEDALIRDFKSELQEQTQARLGTTPVYRLIEESGPDHERTFTVDVLIGETAGGRGTGRSKKEAEQNAAKNALSSDTFGDA
jgi:ribonuclease-3